MSKKKKEAILIVVISFSVIFAIFTMYFLHFQMVRRADKTLSLFDAFGVAAEDLIKYPFDFRGVVPGDFGTLALIVLIVGLVFFVVYTDYALRRHYNPDTVQGDQKLLESLDEYNRKFTDPIGKKTHDGPNNMILCRDMYMCMDNEAVRRNMNVFMIGGSGAGKSYTFVGPNIMQANTSFVVTDPSGGLFKTYGNFLEHKGYHVKCFNLEHMDRGSHYNPFNYIHSDNDIEILVNTLIANTTPPEKSGGDPFWEKSETALLVALIAYLFHYTNKASQSFSSVMKLMRAADINENDSSAKSPLDYMFEEIEEKDPESFAVKQYKTFKMGAGKTLKGILISCAVRLQQFDLAEVANLTDTDDLDLDSLGDEKTALFVIIPTGDTTFAALASMMYSQLFQRLYHYSQNTAEFSQLMIDSDKQVWKTFRAESSEDAKRARAEAEAFFERAKEATVKRNAEYNWYEIRTNRGELVGYRGTEEEAKAALEKLKKGSIISNRQQSNSGQRLPIHLRLIMDEFANCSKVPQFGEKVATIRKYEISVAIILQSLSQMKNLYEKEWEAITGNCDNTIYLGGGADLTTTKWISELLGKETRVVMNMSYSKSGGSQSLNRTGVELLTPAQLRTLNENECIVLPKSLSAFKGRKYPARDHPNWPLVEKLNKEYGSYAFNAQKSIDLMSERIAPELVINDIHGETMADDAETVALKNEGEAQIGAEFEHNADALGNPIIGEAAAVKASGEGIEETLPLGGSEAAGEAAEASIDMTEEYLAVEELVFSQTQAHAS